METSRSHEEIRFRAIENIYNAIKNRSEKKEEVPKLKNNILELLSMNFLSPTARIYIGTFFKPVTALQVQMNSLNHGVFANSNMNNVLALTKTTLNWPEFNVEFEAWMFEASDNLKKNSWRKKNSPLQNILKPLVETIQDNIWGPAASWLPHWWRKGKQEVIHGSEIGARGMQSKTSTVHLIALRLCMEGFRSEKLEGDAISQQMIEKEVCKTIGFCNFTQFGKRELYSAAAAASVYEFFRGVSFLQINTDAWRDHGYISGDGLLNTFTAGTAISPGFDIIWLCSGLKILKENDEYIRDVLVSLNKIDKYLQGDENEEVKTHFEFLKEATNKIKEGSQQIGAWNKPDEDWANAFLDYINDMIIGSVKGGWTLSSGRETPRDKVKKFNILRSFARNALQCFLKENDDVRPACAQHGRVCTPRPNICLQSHCAQDQTAVLAKALKKEISTTQRKLSLEDIEGMLNKIVEKQRGSTKCKPSGSFQVVQPGQLPESSEAVQGETIEVKGKKYIVRARGLCESEKMTTQEQSEHKKSKFWFESPRKGAKNWEHNDIIQECGLMLYPKISGDDLKRNYGEDLRTLFKTFDEGIASQNAIPTPKETCVFVIAHGDKGPVDSNPWSCKPLQSITKGSEDKERKKTDEETDSEKTLAKDGNKNNNALCFFLRNMAPPEIRTVASEVCDPRTNDWQDPFRQRGKQFSQALTDAEEFQRAMRTSYTGGQAKTWSSLFGCRIMNTERGRTCRREDFMDPSNQNGANDQGCKSKFSNGLPFIDCVPTKQCAKISPDITIKVRNKHCDSKKGPLNVECNGTGGGLPSPTCAASAKPKKDGRLKTNNVECRIWEDSMPSKPSVSDCLDGFHIGNPLVIFLQPKNCTEYFRAPKPGCKIWIASPTELSEALAMLVVQKHIEKMLPDYVQSTERWGVVSVQFRTGLPANRCLQNPSLHDTRKWLAWVETNENDEEEKALTEKKDIEKEDVEQPQAQADKKEDDEQPKAQEYKKEEEGKDTRVEKNRYLFQMKLASLGLKLIEKPSFCTKRSEGGGVKLRPFGAFIPSNERHVSDQIKDDLYNELKTLHEAKQNKPVKEGESQLLRLSKYSVTDDAQIYWRSSFKAAQDDQANERAIISEHAALHCNGPDLLLDAVVYV